MLINDKGQIFSVCEKAMTQYETCDLERVRDINKAVIEHILGTYPGKLGKRGFELPSGNIHGIIKDGDVLVLIYVCPVINQYEPTCGQVLQALAMASEVPSKQGIGRIDFLVVNMSNGSVELQSIDYTSNMGILTVPVEIGEHCKLCQFQGGCS